MRLYNYYLITNALGEEYDLYITDKVDTVFYMTDLNENDGERFSRGILYKYTIGGLPYKVAEDIVWTGDYFGKLSGVNGRSILKADEAYFLRYEYDNDAYTVYAVSEEL